MRSLNDEKPDLIDDEGHDPGDEKGEEERKARPAPAPRFLVDGRDGRRAGDIEDAEHHQAEGVEGGETDGSERRRKGFHALGRARIDDAEEDGAARNDELFCGDARNEGDDDLPEPESDRDKDGHEEFAHIGGKTSAHIFHKARGAEIEERPDEDGGNEDGGACFDEVVLDLLPHIDGDGARIGELIFGQFDDEIVDRFLFVDEVDDGGDGDRHDDADEIHREGGEHRVCPEEHLRKEDVDGEAGVAAHEGGDEHHLEAVALTFECAGRHDGGHRAAEAQEHGDERLAREPELAHDALHDVSNARHVAAVFEEGERQKEDEDVGQEGEDGPDAADDAVDEEGDEDGVRADGGEPRLRRIRKPAEPQLEERFDGVAHIEGEEEDERHDAEEDGDAPHRVREGSVELIGEDVLPLLVDHDFMDDLVDEVVFLIDDVRFVTSVEDGRKLNGVFFRDLLVAFQKLDGVPAFVGRIGVLFVEFTYNGVDLVLDGIRVDHRVFRMVVVDVMGRGLVVVDEVVGSRAVLVVEGGVEEGVEPLPLSRRHGDDGDAEHLGQAVHINLHAALCNDVHHVESHDNGLAEL